MSTANQESGQASPPNLISVGLGELYITNKPELTLAAFALGSCIALCAHDPVAKVGGLAHIVLPALPLSLKSNGEIPPGKYADKALPEMIVRLERLGASRERFIFKLVGGAAVLSGAGILSGPSGPIPSRLDIGRRNVQGVINALFQAGFFPVAADFGGQAGRTVFFWPTNGKMRVRTLRGEERDY